jgi:hypothetical protein
MIPHLPRIGNERAVVSEAAVRWRQSKEDPIMDHTRQDVPSEPPSPSVEAPFLVRAFGYATHGYWAMLTALFDGLSEYEARKGGQHHAPQPLPAA